MKLKKIYFLLFIVTLSSCGSPFEEPVFNANGSYTRSNNYENYNNFEARVVETNYFNRKDPSNDDGGSHIEPLVVGTNDLYLLGSDAKITYVSQDKIVSEFIIPDSSAIASRPAADLEQNIYLVSLNSIIYSFDKTGKLRWKSFFSDGSDKFEMFSDVLAVEDGIVVGSTSGKLMKFAFDGKKIFEKRYNAGISRSFAADKNGNIYFALTNNQDGETDNLLMIKPNGDLVFNKAIEFVRIIKNPVVSGDNIYLIGNLQKGNSRGSLIMCYDKRGHEKWRKEIPVFPRYISTNSKNEVFLSGYNTGVGEAMSGIYSFSPSGKQLWKLYISAAVSAPLLVGSSSIAVSGNTSKGAALFYIHPRNGRMLSDKALNEVDPFYSVPSVLGDGSIIFGITNRKGIIRVTDSPINKILPW